MTSIRDYLLRTLTLVLVVSGGVAVLASYLISDHELEEMLDTQLSLHSRIVAGQLPENTSDAELARLADHLSIPGYPARAYHDGKPLARVGDDGTPPRLYHEEERKLALGLWTPDKTPRLLQGKWTQGAPFPAPDEEGFRWVDYAGHRWRVFSMFDEGHDVWISMGQRSNFQREIVARITWNNLIPMLLLLPLMLWLMNRIIRRGLKPIRRLSDQVQGRHARDLRHIELDVPHELEGLHHSLNDFIDRLGETLERERRFTADAAHELRTPLAALRIHLDNVKAGETASLQKAYTGVERLQRVVEQLLVLARLDRTPDNHTTPIDLYPIVIELMADLWPLAYERQQQLTLEGLKQLPVHADETEVGILFRNLLDNALRYTPEGGHVEVELSETASGIAQLSVRDSGPGIPDELLEKVTERFRRASDQRTTGSGLGLSIVVELAQRQQATLQLRNRPEHGLEATIVWNTP
ncbi:ATP-binding protein [Chromohalobacter sp. HP20-39]|uniref:ATP-binding protein n=1 Tax=Chromohalobacter sp. HP20-39 TaxID=3079306 RepID=UPI00294B5998|nr:ATP-binding protein [Chromohalobacter sp. HP20-39]MDV6320074.1 ATP-binding protein [Chromohalobacter sp. HP20-39]